MGRSSGMGLDVESSGAGDGLPPGFWFLLGFRVSDGPVEGKNSTSVHLWSRGSCHICGEGAPPHSALETLRLRSGRTEFPARCMGSCLHRQDGGGRRGQGGSRIAPTGEGSPGSAGGCAFRRDGFLPPQERRMGGGSVGRSPLDPSTVLRVSGPSQGWVHASEYLRPARGPE